MSIKLTKADAGFGALSAAGLLFTVLGIIGEAGLLGVGAPLVLLGIGGLCYLHSKEKGGSRSG